MRSHAFSGPSPDVLLESIDAEMEAGFAPTVAFVFQSPVHDVNTLRLALGARGIAVVGMTSAGEIVGDEVLEGSCAVLALELAPGSFCTYLSETEGASTLDQACALGRLAAESFAQPVVFAFASGLQTDGETVVRGVHAGAQAPIPLYGGLAGDDLEMLSTFVFSATGSTTEGIVGLVLDGSRYDARGITTSGWQAVGIEKTVTRAEGNVVHEIDGVPTLDAYEQYFGSGALHSGQRNVVMDLGVQYPLSVLRPAGDAVMRAPLMSVDDTSSLVFAGSVPEGARVKFCIPPSLDIVEKVVEEASRIRAQTPEADALLLVSCAARKTALGPMIEDEIGGLAGLWDAPLVGFFSYGEIGPSRSGRCDFHNETCTLVALSEIKP